jgi:hypothetical protein
MLEGASHCFVAEKRKTELGTCDMKPCHHEPIRCVDNRYEIDKEIDGRRAAELCNASNGNAGMAKEKRSDEEATRASKWRGDNLVVWTVPTSLFTNRC